MRFDFSWRKETLSGSNGRKLENKDSPEQCRNARGRVSGCLFSFSLKIGWPLFNWDSDQYLFRISDPDTKHFLIISTFSLLNTSSFSPKGMGLLSQFGLLSPHHWLHQWILFFVVYQWLQLCSSGL